MQLPADVKMEKKDLQIYKSLMEYCMKTFVPADQSKGQACPIQTSFVTKKALRIDRLSDASVVDDKAPSLNSESHTEDDVNRAKQRTDLKDNEVLCYYTTVEMSPFICSTIGFTSEHVYTLQNIGSYQITGIRAVIVNPGSRSASTSTAPTSAPRICVTFKVYSYNFGLQGKRLWVQQDPCVDAHASGAAGAGRDGQAASNAVVPYGQKSTRAQARLFRRLGQTGSAVVGGVAAVVKAPFKVVKKTFDLIYGPDFITENLPSDIFDDTQREGESGRKRGKRSRNSSWVKSDWDADIGSGSSSSSDDEEDDKGATKQPSRSADGGQIKRGDKRQKISHLND